jgi:hypothetical protein
MAQIGYSKKVMEHFMNPRNVGVIENPDGYGQVGNPVCGDLMEIFISVKEDKIDDIKFRTFGCGSAIAVSSMVTEMAKGKTLDQAMLITSGGAGRAAAPEDALLQPGGGCAACGHQELLGEDWQDQARRGRGGEPRGRRGRELRDLSEAGRNSFFRGRYALFAASSNELSIDLN